MPRNGGGVFSLASTYEAISGEVIEAQQHNDPLEDLEQDANAARPIVAGGTGATTAIAATDNFSTKGADIASASTTDIGAATGRFVHITGTTTITGFGTKTAGVVRFLTFDGALILTHNATSLILPGAANITTAAGDSAVMISEGGGNWRCLSFSRAAGGALIGAGKGTAIASATTVSIGAELFYHITGTTTITDVDFTVAGDGRWAILEFDGALTLTHNATTLVLPGGANITTAAGDIAVIVQDSGDNVHVVSYQRKGAPPMPAIGTAGQVLRVNSGATAPEYSAPLVLGTPVTASGTSVTFSSIPSWVRRIHVSVAGLSTNGTSRVLLRIGSGSLESTSYDGGEAANYSSSLAAVASQSAGFVLPTASASALRSGTITLTLLNASTNLWVAAGVIFDSGTTAMGFLAGQRSLSGVLDRVAIVTANGSDTFDAGSINILYE